MDINKNVNLCMFIFHMFTNGPPKKSDPRVCNFRKICAIVYNLIHKILHINEKNVNIKMYSGVIVTACTTFL